MVYFANTRHDPADIGFVDEELCVELVRERSARRVRMIPLMRYEAQEAFGLWADKQDKTPY